MPGTEALQRSVLVVDDEPDIRFIVGLTLECAGHRVLTAGCVAEALAQLDADTPDVLLLDVMLPDASGWDLLDEIRARGGLGTTKLVVCSAGAGETGAVRAAAYGGTYLRKPFLPRDLLQHIEELLSV